MNTKVFREKKKFRLRRSAAFDILNRHVIIVSKNKIFHLPAIPLPYPRKIYEAFNIEINKKLFIRKNFFDSMTSKEAIIALIYLSIVADYHFCEVINIYKIYANNSRKKISRELKVCCFKMDLFHRQKKRNFYKNIIL
jgi:hypothetical protein